jgi:hypothetical protein
LQRLWHEPALHFAVLGLGLFALYRVVSGGSVGAPDEIVVDGPQIAALAEQFTSAWRRPPTAAEIEAMIERHVRDEVLYREGLALGLDQDDPVIRNRIRLKMEILGDGLETALTDAELTAWFDENRDRYAAPARYDVRQVYFDPARHGADLAAEVDEALATLVRDPERDPATLGDSTMLAPMLVDVTEEGVAAQLGDAVAATLSTASIGHWFGPIGSPYGEHLLRVDLRAARRAAVLADVRADVERDLQYVRAQTTRDALYERLRARYTVRVERSASGEWRAGSQ